MDFSYPQEANFVLCGELPLENVCVSACVCDLVQDVAHGMERQGGETTGPTLMLMGQGDKNSVSSPRIQFYGL